MHPAGFPGAAHLCEYDGRISTEGTVMRLVAAVIASLGVIAIEACATPTEAGRREEAGKNSPPMIGLDGKDPTFAAAATRTFPYGRTRCYEAVLATLRNTRGGKAVAIARADPVDGTVVSNKMVINRGARATHRGEPMSGPLQTSSTCR